MTEWRAIPGYEGRYEVSDDGQVRSLTVTVTARWSGRTPFTYERPGRVLKPNINEDGYHKYTLYRSKRDHKTVLAHQIVLLAFVGPLPDGMEGRHLDGTPGNNSLVNLAYGTHAQNHEDKRAHGRLVCGAKHPKAKLTPDSVRQIRKLSAEHSSYSLAGAFGVSATTVRDMLNGKTWRHVA